jgi:CheY-like chemotaxis protein
VLSLRFEVEDTGVGITPEQVEKIFEPFEQVGETARRTEGTGLGLAISRQLVELMGGTLEVKSESGKGSTFWFEAAFPVIKGELEKEALVRREIMGYAGEPQHILAVDDRAEVRLMLLNLLEPLGFAVTLAENGQEAMARAQEIQPDFILMDLVMPVMNGFEAVKAVRQIPELKDVPIIAISASAYGMDQKQSRAVGCDAFLAKPIETQKLFELLETHLPIEWVYKEIPGEEETALSQPESELVPPPQEELEVLYELAILGRMRRIREQADHLEELDERYIPFARRLREFARRFDDKQIIELVQQYMKENI